MGAAPPTHPSSTDLDTDQALALLRQVASGDEAAFRRLHTALGPVVFAYAHSRLRDPQAAREVVDETLLDVWRKPLAFAGQSALTTWVIGIARHKILDRFRDARPEHEDIDDYRDTLPATGPDGYAALADKQRQAALAHCLERLAPSQRECLHLVYFAERSLAEVGVLQDVPENTVKTRLFHARARLKTCLEAKGAQRADEGLK